MRDTLGRSSGATRAIGAAGAVGAALVLALGMAGAARADDCPNAEIRAVQGATPLPDCRAWEQVSPVDKAGQEAMAAPAYAFPVNAAGDRVVYLANGTFPGAPTSVLQMAYLGVRSGDGWGTSSVEVAQSNGMPAFDFRNTGVAAISGDLSHAVVVSRRALTPGAVEGDANSYLRDNASGALQLIYTRPSSSALFDAGAKVYGSADFGRLLFLESAALTPDAPDDGRLKVYEFSNGRLHLASLSPDGSPYTAGDANFTTTFDTNVPRIVSDDGARAFLTLGRAPGGTSFEPGAGVVMREDGRSVPISVSQRAGDGDELQPGAFADASSDGSIVYFWSTLPLTDASNPDGVASLYRYDVTHGTLLDLTPTDPVDAPFGPQLDTGSIHTSADGSRVFFVAAAKLTPEADSGIGNIYRWADGRLTWIASSATLRRVTISRNGRALAWEDYDEPAGYVNVNETACPYISTDGNPDGRCQVIKTYDFAREQVECVSCDWSGAAPNGHATLGGLAGWAVSDDGRVFFESPDRLVAGDVNSKRDVYEFQDGEQRLLSSGHGAGDARIDAATADGRSVFFTTDARLVRQDRGADDDVYVARIDGGLTSQNLPDPPATCSGDGCKGAPTPPPSGAAGGSASYRGAGNLQAPRRATVAVSRGRVSGATATLRVRVSGAGTIRVAGPSVRRVSRSVRRSATYALRVGLSARAALALRRNGVRRAAVTVAFTPASGSGSSKRLTVTFRQPSKGGR